MLIKSIRNNRLIKSKCENKKKLKNGKENEKNTAKKQETMEGGGNNVKKTGEEENLVTLALYFSLCLHFGLINYRQDL